MKKYVRLGYVIILKSDKQIFEYVDIKSDPTRPANVPITNFDTEGFKELVQNKAKEKFPPALISNVLLLSWSEYQLVQDIAKKN